MCAAVALVLGLVSWTNAETVSTIRLSNVSSVDLAANRVNAVLSGIVDPNSMSEPAVIVIELRAGDTLHG